MRKHALAIIALVLLSFVAALGTASASPDTVTVNSTTEVVDGNTSSISALKASPGSDGVISLPEAIYAANNTAGSDTIEFNIPTSDAGYEVNGITGTWTISLTSSLPALSGGGTIISGTTQAVYQGDLNVDGPEIEISGASMSTGECLRIQSAGNVVHGLVINSCPTHGVNIIGASATGNTVSGNYIGTDATGSSDLGNGQNGVEIRDGAQDNVIGGDSPGERNVLSGNAWNGVRISTGSGNIISGNYIGTDASGSSALANDATGVGILGDAANNVVGGDTEAERNIIAASKQYGVHLGGSGVVSNRVSGNYIGTDVTGTLDRGNAWGGVFIWTGAQNNTVGGDTEGERNVISGNDRDGVVIGDDATVNNVVCGNYIGTDASGNADLANSWNGVWITGGAQNNTVGGQAAGERNVISGNGWSGVDISGTDSNGNTVLGNYIGTDETGALDRGNGKDGVRIESSAQNNTVGPDNLIAYNTECGVSVYYSQTTGNTVTQNSIHSNDDMGIQLFYGGNGNIPAPAVTAASTRYAMGTAGAGDTVEVFTGPDAEGKQYLGTTSADGNGIWLALGPFTLDTWVTATATDASGNTSRFSAWAVPGDCSPVFVPLTMKGY
jgi:hypothetical protein